MPKQGPHPVNKLKTMFVASTKKPGRFADGHGLYLVVESSGAKRWILRATIQGGRRTDMGLGSVSVVSLAEAREKAAMARKLARDGKDPVAERREQRIKVPTFREAAEQVHSERLPTFRNVKHAAQWISTLRTYAFPKIGDMPVKSIATSHIVGVLSPIWLTKVETASRLKQRLFIVFQWAKAHGFLIGDNPASTVQQALPRQTASNKHHAAIPYTQIHDYMLKLRAGPGSEATKLGLELILLTWLRTSEVVLGEWDEVNWAEQIWTIPAERQKKKKIPEPHEVPLAPRALEVLRRLQALSNGSRYMFPSADPSKPVSNMTFLMALKRLGQTETVHGFRSTGRTWADEETDYGRNITERALGHTIKDKSEASYRRGTLLEKRRRLMNDWESFVLAESMEKWQRDRDQKRALHPVSAL